MHAIGASLRRTLFRPRRQPPAHLGLVGIVLLITVALMARSSLGLAAEAGVTAYTIVGDAIPNSLTAVEGDVQRGREIVKARQTGLCLLCHTGPFPEERLQGNLAPDLTGAGARWSEGQLRLRMVDAARINPDTIMPSYYRAEGFARVAPALRGRTILTAAEVEDVVAFLASLR